MVFSIPKQSIDISPHKDNSWQAVERGRLTEADVQFFQRLQQLLIEAQKREQLERQRKQEQLGFDLEP